MTAIDGKELERASQRRHRPDMRILAGLATIVPAGPGLIHMVDAAIILGLGAIAVENEKRLTFAILVCFIVFAAITVVGLLLMLSNYGGLGKLRMRAEREVK